MQEHAVKYFVFSSSAAVYGDPQFLPMDEKHPLQPINYYGYTKMVIEQILHWYDQLKGLRYAALRYFNATGYDVKGRIRGKEKNPGNLSPIIMEVAAGTRPVLRIFGEDYKTPDGTCIRDYIHVSDLADAHLKAMNYLCEKEKSLVVNLGTGHGYSVLEMLETARKISGLPIPHEIGPRRPGDPPELYANCQLAEKLLQWKAKYSSVEQISESMCRVYLK
jgi:UDP-glucose 4-epimerase